MALSLSAIFKQLTGNGTYDPGAQARAALQSSNSSMVKSMFSPTPAKPAAPAAPAQNMSYNTANGLPPSASNPLNTAPSGGTAPTPPPGPTGGTSVFSGGPTGATGPTASAIPQEWINPAGGFYTPDEVAANIAKSAQYGAGPAAGNGDIPQYAGNLLTQGPQSAEQLQAAAAALNNSRNDISTGATDPYKVGSQSGIAYTPAELDAIEKAYAGIYDPAINTALSKLDAKQKADAADNAPFTLGQDQVRYSGDGTPLAVGPSSSSAALNGLGLGDYTKKTTNGNQYVDLSTVTDAKEKAAVEGAARAAGVPVVTDADASKINAIEDTRTNLDQIAQQFANVGYKNGATKTAGLFGLTNDIAGLFGDKDIGSFNAWRTAAINSIQALAGGTGSGLRINQAEINSAMQNDIPNKNDTVAVGNAKLDVLRKQLNNWEQQLIGGGVNKSVITPDERAYLKSQGKTDAEIDDYQEQSGKVSVGNTTASTGAGNVPQRNNNPGDVKQGGVADKYASGVDSQGHLIFDSPEIGFKALQDDLQAKISGNSKYLPANPSIAQLASVYAQDPTWGPKVASLLGVSTTTKTKSIPIAALAKAIATQEGYYA